MGVRVVGGRGAPGSPLSGRAAPAALFGLGTALVLDEFALILPLRDVYWSNEGRLSIDAVFVAVGVSSLLLIGVSPVGVKSVADYHHLPGSPGAVLTLVLLLAEMLVLAGITLLKGKIWTGLIGMFVPVMLIIGAIRLGRPGSPWARWRYQQQPGKLAKAVRREQRLRQPVIHAKIRLQDLLAGRPDQPAIAAGRSAPAHPERSPAVGADASSQRRPSAPTQVS